MIHFNLTQKLMLALLAFVMFIVMILDSSLGELDNGTPHHSTELTKVDTTQLFQNVIFPNRLEQFRLYLSAGGIRVHNEYELLLILSQPILQPQLKDRFCFSEEWLVWYAELAALQDTGIKDLDAQLLLFSQRNYQCPFTQKTISLHSLSIAQSDDFIEDILGWQAGHPDSLSREYRNWIIRVEDWILRAKGRDLFFVE